jgi:hypothetical protein
VLYRRTFSSLPNKLLHISLLARLFPSMQGGLACAQRCRPSPLQFLYRPFCDRRWSYGLWHEEIPCSNVAACFLMIGLGLQTTTLLVTSATRNWVGFEILAGIGLGLLVSNPSMPRHMLTNYQFTATTFPILAPLPVSDNATALSLFIFIRSFFQVSQVVDRPLLISDMDTPSRLRNHHRRYRSPKPTGAPCSPAVPSHSTPGNRPFLCSHPPNRSAPGCAPACSAECLRRLSQDSVVRASRDFGGRTPQLAADERSGDAENETKDDLGRITVKPQRLRKRHKTYRPEVTNDKQLHRVSLHPHELVTTYLNILKANDVIPLRP